MLVRCPAADRRLRALASAAASRHRPRTPDGRIATRACAFRLAHIPVWDRRSHRSRRRRRRWRRTPIQARRAASRGAGATTVEPPCAGGGTQSWPVAASRGRGREEEPEEVSAHCSFTPRHTTRTPRTPSAGWSRRGRSRVCPGGPAHSGPGGTLASRMPSRDERLAHDVRFHAKARTAAPAKPSARSLAAAADGGVTRSAQTRRRAHPPNTAAGSKSALQLLHLSFIRFSILSYYAIRMLHCIASGLGGGPTIRR